MQPCMYVFNSYCKSIKEQEIKIPYYIDLVEVDTHSHTWFDYMWFGTAQLQVYYL